MQNLRFIERRNQELVFESEAGTEFRFAVDDEFIDAVRAIGRVRPARPSSRVSPREIQTLLRAGTARNMIIEQLGIESEDIDRYEGPILAEFQFMLTSARQVPVRTDPNEEEPQTFGEVIEERLDQLSATDRSWSTWKHEEDGWMVQVEFDSHGSLHTASWTFDHRKSLLTPITPDAVNLSKQGDVGEKLIPTLRVVDRVDASTTFDADAFDVLSDAEEHDDEHDSERGQHPFVSAPAGDDYSRRQEIEHRAIATDPTPSEDLGQTADLLDALRKRRSDREAPQGLIDDDAGDDLFATSTDVEGTPHPAEESAETTETDKRPRKGRASIPSWDDILFGTRSEEDS